MSDYEQALIEFSEEAEAYGRQFAEEVFTHTPHSYEDEFVADVFGRAEDELAENHMEVFTQLLRDRGFNDETILESAKKKGVIAFKEKLLWLRRNHTQEGSA